MRPDFLRTGVIQGIIFDYDGLLVDSEDIWFQSCRRVCAKYGIEVTEAHRSELMTGRLSAYLKDRFELPDPLPRVRRKLNGTYDYLARGLKFMPGAQELVTWSAERFRIAIGSAGRSRAIERDLRRFGLHHHFGAIVGGDHVKNVKPHPDIFLLAAEKLGLPPEQTVVLEDSPRGIQAAKAAGAYCIAIPGLHIKEADYSKADLVVSSLVEVKSFLE